MSWYCDRCGKEYSNSEFFSKYDYSPKNTSKNRDFLKEHDVPSFMVLCDHCYYYLIGGAQNYVDDKYLVDEEDSIGCSSRYNPDCAEFDKEYGFEESYNDDDDDTDEEDSDSNDYEDDDFEEDSEEDNEELTFVDNADDIVLKKLREDQNKALFKTLTNTSNNNYQTVFASTMQSYLVHIALIINDVASKPIEGKKYLPECLTYLCNTILCEEDKNLYNKLIKINSTANNVKHKNKKIEIDIKEYLKAYNKLIKKIISKTDLDSFGVCYISSKKEAKDKGIIICHICGHSNIQDYYICPSCKKITCPDCYDKQKKLCEVCVRLNSSS